MVELGRVVIKTEVSLEASHSTLPRVGHFDAEIIIFACMKAKPNSHMIYVTCNSYQL
jgi:hypothetical protein